MADFMTKRGLTSEGMPFEMIFEYPPGAPDGTLPIGITGSYSSRDGGGSFSIVQRPDGSFEDSETGDTAPTAIDLIPWVIDEGDWT